MWYVFFGKHMRLFVFYLFNAVPAIPATYYHLAMSKYELARPKRCYRMQFACHNTFPATVFFSAPTSMSSDVTDGIICD